MVIHNPAMHLPDAFTHGGPDAQGIPLHDFSTNANACGPCPAVMERLAKAPAHTYPDPHYTALRARLAQWHGVDVRRIILGASASELIFRITAAVVRASAAAMRGGMQSDGLSALPRVHVPRHGYGDYRRAAEAWGLPVVCWDEADPAPGEGGIHLVWITEPASPLGDTPPGLAALLARASHPGCVVVVDRAYAPLRLTGADPIDLPSQDRVWQLFSPNKALGLTGVRGAYLVAPRHALERLDIEHHSKANDMLAHLHALAPSWPLGAHAEAMLMAWPTPSVQQWLAQSLHALRDWKMQLEAGLQARGWHVHPGCSTFCCARPPWTSGTDERAGHEPHHHAQTGGVALSSFSGHSVQFPVLPMPREFLSFLRQHGIKLRDTTSFGLSGWFRLGVRPPQSQQALWQALDDHAG